MRSENPQTVSQRTRTVRSLVVCVAAFTLVAGSAVVPATELSPASVFGSLLGRNDQPLKQYRAFRRMHAATEKGSHEAWLEAWTELKDGRFSYQIVSERGSETVRGWDAGTVTARLEAAVGRDLQYIRINGTLVGGLVGLVLHAVDSL